MHTLEQNPDAASADGQLAGVVAAGTTDPMVSPQSTKHVLHVINGEHYSGAERVQDLLAMRLPEFGVEAAFACIKPDRFPRDRQSNAHLYDVRMRGRFDLRTALRVAAIVRTDRYQLLHAHTPRSALVGRLASLMTGVPFVYHVHSPTSRDSTHRWRNWLNNASERVSLVGASALIAVSHSLGRHMRLSGYRADRVAVVPNGVPTADERRDVRLPGPTWTLGTVALFRPRKGLEVLIDALAAMRQANTPVRLRAVGAFETPDYEAKIKEHVERRCVGDLIEWVGFTRDVARELTKMDLFVLPSLFGEGLPMVVLEALAAGVPVVGTRVEGVPEAIDDGMTGLLADPGDASSLAHAIQRLIEGDFNWSALRANAIRTHGQRYSDVQMARQVAEVYRAVLENQPLAVDQQPRAETD